MLRCSWARQRTFSTDPVERAPSPLLGRVREAVTAMERAGRVAPDATQAVLATAPVAERVTFATIDRNARKGQQPSEHAPVIVDLADLAD